MRELWPGGAPAPRVLLGRKSYRGDNRVKGDAPKSDDDHCPVHQFYLAEQVGATIQNLAGKRLVFGRRAMYHSGDVAICQSQTIITINRSRLICEPGFVERAVEPIATAVSGKYTPCPVSSVRRGRKADYQQPRIGVAEARHRPAPVIIRGKATHLLASNLLSPYDQSRAAPATGHSSLKLCQRGRIINATCPILHRLEY
jgi:hypothetical protein